MIIKQDFTSEEFKKVRKLPVVVHAMEIPEEWSGFVVETMEGHSYPLAPGDFLMRGVQGELYPCDREVYLCTYESAE